MQYTLRGMTIEDYDTVYALWQRTEYMNFNECDTREGIDLYLNRNPGLCFVAEQDSVIVGAVLCGHDGRRGFLRHLAVAAEARGQGIARALINNSLNGLAAQGIGKCNIFVEDENVPGLEFWKQMGWVQFDYTFRMLQAGTQS